MTRKNNLSARWLRVLIAMAMLVSLAVMTMPGSAEDVGVTVVDDAAIIWPTWQDPAYLKAETDQELDVQLAVWTSTGGYAQAIITLTLTPGDYTKDGVIAGTGAPDTWPLEGIDASDPADQDWHDLEISAKHPTDHPVWQVTEVFTDAVCIASADGLEVAISTPETDDFISGSAVVTGTATYTGCAPIKEVKVSILDEEENLYWASGTWIVTETLVAATGTDTWSFDLSPVGLTEGMTYTVCAVTWDMAGNESDEDCVTGLVVDDTAPDVAITTEVDAIVCTAPSVISGTITDTVSGIDGVVWALRNVTTNRWWDEDSSWVYSTTPIWNEGSTNIDGDEWGVELPGLLAPRGYEFWVVGMDNAGNDSDIVGPLSFFYAQCADIGLWNGWNLVSLPLIPADPDLETLLDDMIDDIAQVRTWFWEEGVLTPRGWVNGGPADLDEMVDGQGYWWDVDPGVGAAAPEPFWWLTIQGLELPLPPAVPPTYAVSQGWNLIGFKCLEEAWAAGYLGDVSLTVQAMYGWDADTGSYFLVWGNDDLYPGLGYWLAVSQNGTIYPKCSGFDLGQ